MTQWQQCLIEKNNPTFNLTIDAESFSLIDGSASCVIDCAPEVHISRFCTQELSVANSCVQSEAACTECFEPDTFMDTFPDQVDWYFRSTFSFTDPTSEDFCVEANWRVCKKFYPPEHGEAVSTTIMPEFDSFLCGASNLIFVFYPDCVSLVVLLLGRN